MVILICGMQDIQVKTKIKEIKSKYLGDDINDFNFIQYDLEQTSLNDVVSEALTQTFGYDKKLIVCRNPYFLLANAKTKVSFEQDFEMFNNYLKSEDEESCIIIYTVGKFDARKALVKEIKKLAKVYDLGDIDKNEWQYKVKNLILNAHIEINENDIDLFIERVGNDLGQMMKEIEKLGLYSKVISRKDIEKLIPRQLEDNAFQMLDSIINRNMQKLMQNYYDLKLLNEEPTKIIGLMASQLHLQYQVLSLLKKGENERSIASTLGIHWYRVSLMCKNDSKISMKDILYLLDKLSKLDIDIKTGTVDRYQAFELFLLKHC